jgi:hypothetical protein
MQASAEALRQSADQITFPKLDMSHPAAPAGDRLATIAQLFIGGAGLLKSGARSGIKALAKSGSRALAGEADDAAKLVTRGSSAARTARSADTAGDALKTEKTLAREVQKVDKMEDAAAATTAAGRDGVIIKKRKLRSPTKRNKNFDFEKTVYNEDGSITYTLKDGRKITYRDGYPDFSSYKKAEVKLENMTGDIKIDGPRASQSAFGTSKTPTGFTWHHVQDGKTLQLVPTSIHSKVPHTGGASILRTGP